MSGIQDIISSPSINVQILHILAISGSALTAGLNLGTSIVAIPSFLQSPSPFLAKQWKVLYDRGLRFVIPCGIVSTAAFAGLAYSAYVQEKDFPMKLYSVAAVTAFGFAPYTRLLMWGVNHDLMEAAEKPAVKNVSEREVQDLVRQWSKFNFFRGLLPLAAVVLGTWAAGYGSVSA